MVRLSIQPARSKAPLRSCNHRRVNIATWLCHSTRVTHAAQSGNKSNASDKEERNDGKERERGLVVQIIEILIPFCRGSDSHLDRVGWTVFKSACSRGCDPGTMRAAKAESKRDTHSGRRLYTWLCMRTLRATFLCLFILYLSFFVSFFPRHWTHTRQTHAIFVESRLLKKVYYRQMHLHREAK